jgi:hypothetical protein
LSNSTALPTGCYDEKNIVPFVKNTVPRETPKELTLGFTNTRTSDNLVQWLVNGNSMRVDFTRPTLQNVLDGNATFNPEQNLFVVGEKNKVRKHL